MDGQIAQSWRLEDERDAVHNVPAHNFGKPMFIGPVFTRELVTAPRRPRLFINRTVYAGTLLLLMFTAWLVLAGTQVVRNVGDMARFGSILFQLLAPIQLALAVFFAAMMSASAVAQEKDRKTLILLLMTRLTNSELVLGRLLSSLLNILVMILAGLPIFMFAMLFGGISPIQVISVFVVTIATVLASGALGSTIALYREKTFQSLAMTALTLVFWVGVWEAIGQGAIGSSLFGIQCDTLGSWFSPLRAILVAARPTFSGGVWLIAPATFGFLSFAAVTTLALNGIAIAMVRIWNPSRELQSGNERETATAAGKIDEEEAREAHVDSQLRQRGESESRRVWNNSVLWRETCTWAYGRKVIAIRIAYWSLFALTAFALWWILNQPISSSAEGFASVIEATARPLVPFFLVSLVIMNALAVTAITNERDGRSLDLLLVTDLTPREFLFGKLGGVFWNTRDMILLPIALCIFLWWNGRMETENLWFVAGGLLVMNVFVAMLGIHCGMNYANSRTAIGASLGTVFFMFLGVVSCILMMISFSGAFQAQLAPFLAFILGGGVGLYISLGYRNPSPAIAAASLSLPFATFYAIVSFLLGFNLPVFLVTAVTYGFTTAAMMVPALSEFDFAMGRESTADD